MPIPAPPPSIGKQKAGEGSTSLEMGIIKCMIIFVPFPGAYVCKMRREVVLLGKRRVRLTLMPGVGRMGWGWGYPAYVLVNRENCVRYTRYTNYVTVKQQEKIREPWNVVVCFVIDNSLSIDEFSR